jgi:hypothetical protein
MSEYVSILSYVKDKVSVFTVIERSFYQKLFTEISFQLPGSPYKKRWTIGNNSTTQYNPLCIQSFEVRYLTVNPIEHLD